MKSALPTLNKLGGVEYLSAPTVSQLILQQLKKNADITVTLALIHTGLPLVHYSTKLMWTYPSGLWQSALS